MTTEEVRCYVLAVQELLASLAPLEGVACREDIQRFENALREVTFHTDQMWVRCADEIDVPIPLVPTHYAVPLLGDGIPEVPFVIPDVNRTANSAAEFIEIWKQLSEAGICDGWGGSESRRVYGLWVQEGQPKEAARFVCFHANRPAANQ